MYSNPKLLLPRSCAVPTAAPFFHTFKIAIDIFPSFLTGLVELDEFITVIVSKVRCASVLSDILRTCTSTISGRLPACPGKFF